MSSLSGNKVSLVNPKSRIFLFTFFELEKKLYKISRLEIENKEMKNKKIKKLKNS